jgi:exosome complex RNA-binding protein Csl4
MPKKRDNLVSVICSKCKVKLCKTLPGSSVRCPKCKTWSAADGAKADSVA